MHFIYPSEKRKSIIGEFINLNSPTIILTHKLVSDFLTNSPLKIISYSNVQHIKFNTNNYNCIILDPEFFYPSSPLFKTKYYKVYEYLKKTKFKEIRVFSCSLTKNSLKKLLKELRCQDKNITINFDLNKTINVYFGDNKIEGLKEKINLNNKNLIICRNTKETHSLKRDLENTKNIFILENSNFDVRKNIISIFTVKKGALVTYKKFKSLAKKINFSSINYLSIPSSIQELLHDISSFSSDEYNLFVSTKDEAITLRKIKKNPHLKEEYLNFLNFLGFKGNKLEYLKNYLNSRLPNKTKDTDSSGLHDKEKIIFDSLVGRYFRYDDCIDLLMGINDKFLYYGFGSMRGFSREHIFKIINKLVNYKKLGFKYFFSSGNIVKKVY